MLTVYLTRHGETKWNRENRLQGWKDSELTEKGIKDAMMLGKRLNNTPLNVIYTSPSERAFQTAKHVCSDREIPILLEKNLKEIYFGEWEGKNKQEIVENYQKEFSDFWNAPHKYNHQPHNGEAVSDFKQRVEQALKKIIVENSNGNILIVTHAVTIRAIMSFFMNIPTEKMWEPPFIQGTSLTIVKCDEGRYQVEMLGDTSHIE